MHDHLMLKERAVNSLTVRFETEHALQIRTSADPLSTVYTSLLELYGHLQYRLPRSVLIQARHLARHVDMDALLFSGPHGPLLGLEDFLCPGSNQAGVFDLQEQLGMIEATQTETICHEFAVAAKAEDKFVDEARRHCWTSHPEKTLARYVGALRTYITEVVDQIYPDFERRIRREVSWFDEVISRKDISPSLFGPHPSFQLNKREIRISATTKPAVDKRTRSSPILILSPMICSPTTVAYNGVGLDGGDDGSLYQVLSYANANLAVTGLAPPTREDRDPLGTLVGPSRASILRTLRCPSTTTELANDLGYSPSTISHHLKALAEADTIESHRTQWNVYYRLTDTGHQLLRAYAA